MFISRFFISTLGIRFGLENKTPSKHVFDPRYEITINSSILSFCYQWSRRLNGAGASSTWTSGDYEILFNVYIDIQTRILLSHCFGNIFGSLFCVFSAVGGLVLLNIVFSFPTTSCTGILFSLRRTALLYYMQQFYIICCCKPLPFVLFV